MNCTQKLYNKIYLNDVLALILFFLYTAYSGAITSHEMFFSCISTSTLSYGQRFFFYKEACENFVTSLPN